MDPLTFRKGVKAKAHILTTFDGVCKLLDTAFGGLEGDQYYTVKRCISLEMISQLMLLHKQTIDRIDLSIKAIAPLILLELLRTTAQIYAIDRAFVQTLRFGRRNHALQFSFGIRTLETSIAWIPRFALPCRLPFGERLSSKAT